MEIFVISGQEKAEGENSAVYYTIEVRFRNWSNTVEKRYSELLELHRVMKLRRRALNQPIPRFPGKMIWKQIFRKLSLDEIEMRRQGLERYLRELVRCECAKTSPYLPEFFAIPPQVRDQWVMENS